MANGLSKKRRDNDSRARLLILRGEIDAAISDGDCLEDMLRMAEGSRDAASLKPHYKAGEDACDFLDPQVEQFRRVLRAYRQDLAVPKAALEAGK